MAEADLSAARLHSLLKYTPETGLFHRLVPQGGQVVGAIAGSTDPVNGYVRIGVDGHSYKAHRLAWFYVHGVWPPMLIDHKNLNRSDNRLDNLRPATVQQNNQNVVAPRRDSRSGYRGVSWLAAQQSWRATITVNGKQKHLGYFVTPEEASTAYLDAKSSLHPFAACPTLNAPRADS